MLLDRTRVKKWQKLVFGFMVVIMVGFLVMIPLGGQLGCGASSAEEQIAAEIAKYEATLKASPDDVAALRGLGDTYVSRANQQDPRSDAQRADWNLAVEQYEKAVVVLAKEKGAAAREQQVEALKQVVDVRLMAAQVLGQDPALQDAALREYQEASSVYARITARPAEGRDVVFRLGEYRDQRRRQEHGPARLLQVPPARSGFPGRARCEEVDRGQHARAHAVPITDQGDGSMTDQFSVSSERHDALGVIVLVGEVDIYTAPRFKECMLELLDGGVESLLVDLSGVSFIDSTALGVLIGGLRRVHDADGRMALIVTTSAVERVLTITGLDRVFEIHATRAAAEEALA